MNKGNAASTVRLRNRASRFNRRGRDGAHSIRRRGSKGNRMAAGPTKTAAGLIKARVKVRVKIKAEVKPGHRRDPTIRSRPSSRGKTIRAADTTAAQSA